ncbi:MAG: RNA polymerase sigma factor [Oscillospiraceae bacterium]|jgi:RNA polymerase sigma-70 factor (ECF subfamily)|nr:RNA polymerase sigma factor [Oscillospiraceae bacterium]
MTDSAIVSRFNEIYDSTYKPVVAFITAKCGNTADICDISQETYMEIYRLLCRRGASCVRNPKALALKIARQKLARYYSFRERARIFVPLFSESEDGGEIALSDFEAAAFLTEDFTVDKMTVESAKAIIGQKPRDVRKVFYLFYDVGLTIAEIAKEMSVSESNVKHKLYRTLKEIRALLE